MRHIPATMATQHPDNASAPFWETDGDGFISAQEEVREAYAAFSELNVDEYMWDWEGKYVDEAVVERLFSEYHEYFMETSLGRDKFLTFRIPNIWQEKGYSLARAFMAMLTAADMAQDLKIHTPPLFEVILPMTESATQLIHIQETFGQLAKVKHRLFPNGGTSDFRHIEAIPLVEDVEGMFGIRKLLNSYTHAHSQKFRKKIPYLRVFLARSDPALISGMIAAVAGNKVALSELTDWSAKNRIDVYPIIGTGSLPFRGGCNPENMDAFLNEYRGVRTVTIQSAFRYDYDLTHVKHALTRLTNELPQAEPLIISVRHRKILHEIVRKSTAQYHQSVQKVAEAMFAVSSAVPPRRERRLHIGLLGYARKIGKKEFPRAITFTAAMYSLGVPPELIGTGRTLRSLKEDEREVLRATYEHMENDIKLAGRFLNKENLEMMTIADERWKPIQKDIQFLEEYFATELGPREPHEFLHRNTTSDIYFLRQAGDDISDAVLRAGKLRKSLG
ncbi:MAG: phosphoenolpyruvate carboxylase [Candidatus Kerfeldbacteria bacterium]|nr:phosphoenolpyruvate carboxylase [Candidatus Kerfeldbacteria bacterium]